MAKVNTQGLAGLLPGIEQYLVVPEQLYGPVVDYSALSAMVSGAGYGPIENTNNPFLIHFRYDPSQIRNKDRRGVHGVHGNTGTFGR